MYLLWYFGPFVPQSTSFSLLIVVGVEGEEMIPIIDYRISIFGKAGQDEKKLTRAGR